MLKIKNPLIAAVSMALGLGMATGAYAAPVLFDTHDADGVIAIGGFDWAPTSFVAQGGNTAITNFLVTGGTCPVTASCVLNVLTQATLGSFLDADGGALGGAGGLNSRYQITLVAKYQEVVTSVNPTTLTVELAKVTTGPAILEFYYNKISPAAPASTTPPALNTKANQLTGFGFNDGTLILKATTIGDGTAVFDISELIPVSPLDQHVAGTPPGDQYPGQLSQTGTGSDTAFNVSGITQDPTFFLNKINLLDFNNISQSLPFKTVDPMDCFTNIFTNLVVGTTNADYACDNTHVSGPYSAQPPALPNGYLPVPGPVDGLLTSGPDFVGQTDFNSNIAGIPEPTSLVLMGLGLGVLGFGAGRRRHPKAA